MGSEVGVSLATGAIKSAITDRNMTSDLTENEGKCGFSRFLSALCASHRFKNLQVIFSTCFNTINIRNKNR